MIYIMAAVTGMGALVFLLGRAIEHARKEEMRRRQASRRMQNRVRDLGRR